jgi:hypothetical protein
MIWFCVLADVCFKQLARVANAASSSTPGTNLTDCSVGLTGRAPAIATELAILHLPHVNFPVGLTKEYA